MTAKNVATMAVKSKRHIVVDILGNLLHVHAANIHDTKAAGEVMFRAIGNNYPTLKVFSVDAGYRGTAVEYAREKFNMTLHISEKSKANSRFYLNFGLLNALLLGWESFDY